MATTGTALTADFNSTQKGNERLQTYLTPDPVVDAIYRGAICMIDANGKLVPVPVNDGVTDNSAGRVVGQAVTSTKDPLFNVASGITVRTDTVVDVDILQVSGDNDFEDEQVGKLVYATSDHEATKTSTKNPVLGVCVGVNAAAKTCSVAISTIIPS